MMYSIVDLETYFEYDQQQIELVNRCTSVKALRVLYEINFDSFIDVTLKLTELSFRRNPGRSIAFFDSCLETLKSLSIDTNVLDDYLVPFLRKASCLESISIKTSGADYTVEYIRSIIDIVSTKTSFQCLTLIFKEQDKSISAEWLFKKSDLQKLKFVFNKNDPRNALIKIALNALKTEIDEMNDVLADSNLEFDLYLDDEYLEKGVDDEKREYIQFVQFTH